MQICEKQIQVFLRDIWSYRKGQANSLINLVYL